MFQEEFLVLWVALCAHSSHICTTIVGEHATLVVSTQHFRRVLESVCLPSLYRLKFQLRSSTFSKIKTIFCSYPLLDKALKFLTVIRQVNFFSPFFFIFYSVKCNNLLSAISELSCSNPMVMRVIISMCSWRTSVRFRRIPWISKA